MTINNYLYVFYMGTEKKPYFCYSHILLNFKLMKWGAGMKYTFYLNVYILDLNVFSSIKSLFLHTSRLVILYNKIKTLTHFLGSTK